MKKTNLLFAGLLLATLASCGNGGNSSSTPSTNGTLVVGLECNYAPFNWTENSKSNTNHPHTPLQSDLCCMPEI